MDQNEKFLTGWMAYFFSNLNSKGHKTNITYKRATKYIKHQKNTERYILSDAPDISYEQLVVARFQKQKSYV